VCEEKADFRVVSVPETSTLFLLGLPRSIVRDCLMLRDEGAVDVICDFLFTIFDWIPAYGGICGSLIRSPH